MEKHWIAKSIPKKNKGLFKEKSQKAGKTTMQYAEEKKKAPSALGKEAREAETLIRMH